MTHRSLLPATLLALCCCALPAAPARSQEPAPQEHGSAAGPKADEHAREVDERGDGAMGFDHARTTHHFLLTPEGGAIEVTANDPADVESRERIRVHLRHIAGMFTAGNFEIPMLVHDQVPPGSADMQRLKSEIRYQYRELERGASVDITTGDPDALAAIHEFLRFQIRDHRTGDSLEVGEQAPAEPPR
jgi:hypothetical protein